MSVVAVVVLHVIFLFVRSGHDVVVVVCGSGLVIVLVVVCVVVFVVFLLGFCICVFAVCCLWLWFCPFVF